MQVLTFLYEHWMKTTWFLFIATISLTFITPSFRFHWNRTTKAPKKKSPTGISTSSPH